MGTPWDASTYDTTSQPQQEWAEDVLGRLRGIASDATVLDVGCGSGRVTERLFELVPDGRVLAIDASAEMAELARERLGSRAQVWRQSALDLSIEDELDAVFSTATLHWVPDHERLWRVLARALRPGGRVEAQCGGEGNIARVREAIADAAAAGFPELAGWSPWEFAGPETTERRMRSAGFAEVRCWLQERPTRPADLTAFVRTSILAAHLERLAPERREPFVAAVMERVQTPLDYVRLNVSAVRGELAPR
jgi:trans-aconitate 2-methyltransferase